MSRTPVSQRPARRGPTTAPALLAALVAILPLPSAATGNAGWTAPGLVTALVAGERGRILLRIDSDENPSGCREPAAFYLDEDRAPSQQVFDLARDALVHRLPVRAWVTGRCDLKGRSEILRLEARPGG